MAVVAAAADLTKILVMEQRIKDTTAEKHRAADQTAAVLAVERVQSAVMRQARRVERAAMERQHQFQVHQSLMVAAVVVVLDKIVRAMRAVQVVEQSIMQRQAMAAAVVVRVVCAAP